MFENHEFLTVVAIPAVVKFMELVNKKDWGSVAKIVLSVATGILAGVVGLVGLDPLTGALAGLAASGIVTVAQKAAPKQAQQQNVKVTP